VGVGVMVGLLVGVQVGSWAAGVWVLVAVSAGGKETLWAASICGLATALLAARAKPSAHTANSPVRNRYGRIPLQIVIFVLLASVT
jgi:hypothetical protein